MLAAYDPARFFDIENVDEAVKLILTAEAGMTSLQRWRDETPALMRIFENFICPDSKVLDYGCGVGRLAKPLIEKLDCTVAGVDISPKMRRLAASFVDSPHFFALDPMMFDAFVRREEFDAAIAVWTLQHCIDLQDAVDRIAVALKGGGHLIVVNNKGRCVPIANGGWVDDGLDLEAMITEAGFCEIAGGALDESIAPGWMQLGTFWAAYQKA
jgi:SAM-dependent methyltransferase